MRSPAGNGHAAPRDDDLFSFPYALEEFGEMRFCLVGTDRGHRDEKKLELVYSTSLLDCRRQRKTLLERRFRFPRHFFCQRNLPIHHIQIELMHLTANKRRFESSIYFLKCMDDSPLLIRTMRECFFVYAPPDGVSELLMDL